MQIKACRAVVTGGASGLGEATVRNIVRNGGKAVIFDQSDERGLGLQNGLGEAVLFIKANVTNRRRHPGRSRASI